MWKTIGAVGASAVLIGGAGTAAYAASGTPAPTPAASSASATPDGATTPGTAAGKGATPGKHQARDRIRRAVHASWVTENKKARTFTTHEAIRGQVTAVSTASITVKSADNVTETFVVNPATKVWTRTPRTAADKAAASAAPSARTPASRTAASIAEVAEGDIVFVGGTGTSTLTAIRVIDVKR